MLIYSADEPGMKFSAIYNDKSVIALLIRGNVTGKSADLPIDLHDDPTDYCLFLNK